MLIDVKLRGEQILPSQIRGKYAYEKNIILIIRSLQGRVLFIDYIVSNLGNYSPPPILQGKSFFYEIIRVSEEHLSYLDCITKQVEEKLNPVFKNKKLECKKEVTVIINENI